MSNVSSSCSLYIDAKIFVLINEIKEALQEARKITQTPFNMLQRTTQSFEKFKPKNTVLIDTKDQ